MEIFEYLPVKMGFSRIMEQRQKKRRLIKDLFMLREGSFRLRREREEWSRREIWENRQDIYFDLEIVC